MFLSGFSSVSAALGGIGIRYAKILQYIAFQSFHFLRLGIFEMIVAKEVKNAVNGQMR